MTPRRWAAVISGATIVALSGCTAEADSPSDPASPSVEEASPSSEETPAADATWADPLPGPGPDILYFQYPALEGYELEAYDYKRPYEPPNPDFDYTETVIWMAPGAGQQLADGFATEPLSEPLALLSDWPDAPPTDLETSEQLIEDLRIGFEEHISVAVSPGADLLFIVTEGDESAPASR